MDTKERLAEVRLAIRTILISGQSYQIGTRKLSRADLGLLRQMETDLEAEIAAEECTDDLLPYTRYVRFERR